MPVFVQIKHTRYNTLISELETCSSGRFCYLQTEQARFFSPRRDPGEKTGLMFRMTLMLSYANKFTVQTRDWCRSTRLTLGNETSVFLFLCGRVIEIIHFHSCNFQGRISQLVFPSRDPSTAIVCKEKQRKTNLSLSCHWHVLIHYSLDLMTCHKCGLSHSSWRRWGSYNHTGELMEICQRDAPLSSPRIHRRSCFWPEPDVCRVHVDVLAIVWRAYSFYTV